MHHKDDASSAAQRPVACKQPHRARVVSVTFGIYLAHLCICAEVFVAALEQAAMTATGWSGQQNSKSRRYDNYNLSQKAFHCATCLHS